MRSRITLVPNPGLVGVVTGGPPVSCHSSLNFAGVSPLVNWYQRTDTLPRGIESAPYLAAFVASSCRTMAMAWVAAAVRQTVGPSTVALLEAAYGVSSCATRSARLTPRQRLRLSS